MASRPPYHIGTYVDAERIVRDYSTNERWLRSVVSRVSGNGTYADSLSFLDLLRQGHIIRGVAAKMLAARDRAQQKETLEVITQPTFQQLSLFG